MLLFPVTVVSMITNRRRHHARRGVKVYYFARSPARDFLPGPDPAASAAPRPLLVAMSLFAAI
jgi:hypothetical protein